MFSRPHCSLQLLSSQNLLVSLLYCLSRPAEFLFTFHCKVFSWRRLSIKKKSSFWVSSWCDGKGGIFTNAFTNISSDCEIPSVERNCSIFFLGDLTFEAFLVFESSCPANSDIREGFSHGFLLQGHMSWFLITFSCILFPRPETKTNTSQIHSNVQEGFCLFIFIILAWGSSQVRDWVWAIDVTMPTP